MNGKVHSISLVALSLGLGSTAFGAAKPEFSRPTFAGAYEPQGVDERGVWMEADEDERRISRSAMVIHDGQMDSFVRRVLCQTVGEDRCGTVRIYIVNDSSFNASMAPNGMMVVNTGLLARLHSEAELAAVLGHEFAHFELRHTLKHYRVMRSSSDWLAWITLAGIAAATNTYDTRRSIVGATFSFQRGEESEADTLSSQFVRASPYRLRGAEVWARMVAEDDALRVERGAKRVRRLAPALTDTHPPSELRMAFFAKEEAQAGPSGEDDFESYKVATDPILPLMFGSLIKGHDFASADYVIRSRGEAIGWNGSLLTLRGELFRQRGNPRDFVTARDLFLQATQLPDAPPEAWRGLGLSAARLGDMTSARPALAEYLKRWPDAVDAATIRMLLED